jgi:type I restriction enzyme S subunit
MSIWASWGMARTRLYPPSVDPRFPELPPTPGGWSHTKFGGVLEVIARPMTLDANAKYRLLTAKRNRGGITLRGELLGKEILTKTQFEAKAGDFLISRRQIIHGACGIVPNDLDGAVVSNEYSTLRTRPGLLMEFFRHYVHSPYFQRTCFHSSHGVDVEKMIFKIDEWLAREFDAPPIREQKRIAAILSSVDDAIEATQAVIDQLQVVKKAMMAELLTRGLPGRHTKFKVTEIGQVPEEWEVVPLKELFHVQLGKMLNEAARESDGRSPYLANRNVQWGTVRLDDLNTMGFTESEREKFSLVIGDLLVCEGGEVGRTSIWRGELKNCFFQKAVQRLRRRTDRIVPEYVLYFMMMASANGLFLHLTGKSSIAHLTKEKLETVLVSVPPTEEQREIGQALGVMDTRLEAELENATSLRELKTALMSVLLTGDVRVIPDEDAA